MQLGRNISGKYLCLDFCFLSFFFRLSEEWDDEYLLSSSVWIEANSDEFPSLDLLYFNLSSSSWCKKSIGNIVNVEKSLIETIWWVGVFRWTSLRWLLTEQWFELYSKCWTSVYSHKSRLSIWLWQWWKVLNQFSLDAKDRF